MCSGDMSPNTAKKLAALIVAGAEQLEEKSQQQGVTAFLGRAVQRERPNERFLQSTLKNLASANRRADEKVMWAAWEAQKDLKKSSREDRRGRESRDTNYSGRNRDHSRLHSSRQFAEPEDRREDKWRESMGLQRDGQKREQRETSRGRREFDSSSRYHSSCRERKRSRSASRDGGRGHKRRRHERIHSYAVEQQDRGLNAAADTDAVAAAADDDNSSESSDDSRSDSLANGPDAEEPPSGAAEDSVEDDQQLIEWLSSSKAVRGRGSVGPRADLPGPYLKPPEGLNPGEVQQLDQGLVRGPARPSWLKRDDAEGDRKLVPAAGFLRGVLRAQGLVPKGTATEQGLRVDGKKEGIVSNGRESGSESSSSDNSRKQRKSSKHSRKRGRSEKHKKKDKKRKKEKKSRHKD